MFEETTLGEINERLNQISRILEQIGNGQSLEIENGEKKPAESELTAGFLGMIWQAAKAGLRYNWFVWRIGNKPENGNGDKTSGILKYRLN